MNVIVNQQTVELPESSSISSLFLKLKIESQKGIALAVNGQIIRKANWNEFQFSENDKVTIIRATQGG